MRELELLSHDHSSAGPLPLMMLVPQTALAEGVIQGQRAGGGFLNFTVASPQVSFPDWLPLKLASQTGFPDWLPRLAFQIR